MTDTGELRDTLGKSLRSFYPVPSEQEVMPSMLQDLLAKLKSLEDDLADAAAVLDDRLQH